MISSWLQDTAGTARDRLKRVEQLRSVATQAVTGAEINTQQLPGHESQKMTDKYNDDRGKDWTEPAI